MRYINRMNEIKTADSILKVDPFDKNSLAVMAYDNFNNHKTDSAIILFNRLKKIRELNPNDLIILGWAHEKAKTPDSSKYYYKKAIEKMGSEWESSEPSPYVYTALYGKEAGLERYNQIKDKMNINKSIYYEIDYYNFKNSINSYTGGGLSELDPYCFYDNTEKYYLTLNDSLYDIGLNSMNRLTLHFAKKGLNIDVNGTDHSNKSMYAFVDRKYIEELKALSYIKIKKL